MLYINGQRAKACGLAGDPRVSVVLVNWNRCGEVIANIQRLARQRYANLELIVVDNGSTDDSLRQLREQKGLTLIELGQNLGPAKARNAGIDRATGDYVLMLDSDAVLPRTAVRSLVAKMQASADVGIMGCRILNYYSRDIDQWIYPQRYETHGDQAFDTYSFSACGAIARTDVLRQVGGFWDELFIYNEEVDLSIRVIQAGYRVTYCPDVCVYHQVSPNGRVAKGNYYYLLARNWMRIFYRYFPSRYRNGMALKYAALYVFKGLIKGQLGPCVRGLIAGLRDTKIIRQFPEKLSESQVLHLFDLNSRLRWQPMAPLAAAGRAIHSLLF